MGSCYAARPGYRITTWLFGGDGAQAEKERFFPTMAGEHLLALCAISSQRASVTRFRIVMQFSEALSPRSRQKIALSFEGSRQLFFWSECPYLLLSIRTASGLSNIIPRLCSARKIRLSGRKLEMLARGFVPRGFVLPTCIKIRMMVHLYRGKIWWKSALEAGSRRAASVTKSEAEAANHS